MDFRARKIISDKQGHYIILKWSVLQNDKTVFNVYASNNKVSKYMWQKLTELEREMDKSITNEDFTHL